MSKRNSDSEFKEVWYVWDGDINQDMSFILDVTKVRFSDKSYLIVDNDSPYRQKPVMWYLWGDWCESGVRFYTLGQKRRRVECERCHGFYVWAGSNGIEECVHCNKGKVWEYSE